MELVLHEHQRAGRQRWLGRFRPAGGLAGRDPSGAIAQRSQRSQQLLDETNQIWQDTSEFRASQADRQSRDVGCLLKGYYDVEDNSRTYDLLPLPCGQQYGPGD